MQHLYYVEAMARMKDVDATTRSQRRSADEQRTTRSRRRRRAR